MTEELAGVLEQEEDTMLGQYLTFSVDREVYGISIRNVTEIIGIQPVSTLPEAPEYIKGIINLRGKIIPVIDMRIKLKKEPAEYTDRTCIIVVELEEKLAGLIVDSVAEVMSIKDENITAPPELGKNTSSRFISGIGKVDGNVKLLVKLEALLDGESNVIIDNTK